MKINNRGVGQTTLLGTKIHIKTCTCGGCTIQRSKRIMKDRLIFKPKVKIYV